MKLTRALKDFTDLENWVAWKYRDGKKVPYDPNRPKRRADVGDPRTWGAYEEASGADLDGVGIVLLDSGLGAIDLDDCRDPRTGALDDWACEIVKDAMGAYVEVSPSGKGLHILGLARGPQVHRCIRRGIGKVEVYRDCPRYITVTGDVFGRPCRSLANIDGLIDDLAPPRAPQTAGSVDLEAAWTLEWRDVIDRRRLFALRPTIRNSVTTGKRSDVIWKIATTAAERGATREEVACLVYASAAWRSKHGDDHKALVRLVKKAWS